MQNRVINGRTILFAIVCAILTGCDKPKSSARSDTPAPSKEQSVLRKEAAPGGPATAADKAWEEVMSSMREPEMPASWQTNPPSKAEIAAFEKEAADVAASVASKAGDFYARFPEHAKADEARDQEYQLLSLAAQLGDTNSAVKVATLEELQLKNPGISEDDRLEIRMQQLQRRVMANRDSNTVASIRELETGARALQKEFPKRPEIETLLLSVAQGWLSEGQTEKARVLAAELETSISAEVKLASAELLKKIARVGKPVELSFTALDGKQVSVQALKGKVILIDFWATWCRPCLAELPNVKEAYRRFHDQGFEIVGISLDADRAALEKVIAREQMTWPQYFGETDGGAAMAEQFGISGIPAMWLVDRKGNLRDVNARQDLASKVQIYLAESP